MANCCRTSATLVTSQVSSHHPHAESEAGNSGEAFGESYIGDGIYRSADANGKKLMAEVFRATWHTFTSAHVVCFI